ncbi:hypothetical protein ACN47E_007092 [Coniothyrium glycines]
MAVKSDMGPRRAEADAEVSSCISNLIEAFTNGLNIFKRLRERRRKRTARKEQSVPTSSAEAEHRLSKSLRKGPEEIAQKYAECYHSNMGPRFAKGDSIAHASLAETLIKLNTGLVGIITTFLNHDHTVGKGQLKLDYKSLTNLSDASRREAVQSMTQLYHRLSQSQLHLSLYNMAHFPCARCGSPSHEDCSTKCTGPAKEKKRSTQTRQKNSGTMVTRMPIKSSSQPQLVVVRPKNTRKTSNSGSNSSSSSNRSSSTPIHTSPLASPLPMYVPVDPFDLYPPGVIRGTMGTSTPTSRRVDSFDVSRPSTWPHEYMAASEHLHSPTPKLPSFTPAPKRPSPTEKKATPPAPPPPSKPNFLQPMSLPMRRRLDKVTPSSYTFASDSTKLGEIPQRNWTKPWDYEEAERLNAEAAVFGHPTVATTTDEKSSKKKSRFKKFMRRGSTSTPAV